MGFRLVFIHQRKFIQWSTFGITIYSKFISVAPTTVGDGTVGPYTITLPFTPNVNVTVNARPSGLLRGHVDMTGIISTGNNIRSSHRKHS